MHHESNGQEPPLDAPLDCRTVAVQDTEAPEYQRERKPSPGADVRLKKGS